MTINKRKVWVVMGNDYPDCVFNNQSDADAYVECMKVAAAARSKRPIIYWRHYTFELEGQRMRPAVRDIDPGARSHAGQHGDFLVAWAAGGWWVVPYSSCEAVGPFHTSQAAWGAAKDAIDEIIREEM